MPVIMSKDDVSYDNLYIKSVTMNFLVTNGNSSRMLPVIMLISLLCGGLRVSAQDTNGITDTTAYIAGLYQKLSTGKESDMGMAAYGFAGIKRNATADSVRQLVKAKYPHGLMAFNEFSTEVVLEPDPKKKELMLGKVSAAFTEADTRFQSSYNDMRVSIAVSYTNAGDTGRGFYYLRQVTNSVARLVGANSMAKACLANGENETALQIMKKVMDTIHFSPETILPAEKFVVASYAKILCLQNHCAQALALLQPLYKPDDNTGVRSTYADLLLANGQDTAAVPLIAQLMKEGAASGSMKQKLKAGYSAIHGGTAGYDAWLAPLLQAEEAAKQQQIKKLMIRENAPAFELPDRTGKLVSKEAMKGKTVIIDIWSTYCGPCIASFPMMQELVNDYKADTNVVFLFLNQEKRDMTFKQRVEDIQRVLNAKKVDLPVLLDKHLSEFVPGATSRAYGAMMLPTKVIIDGNGVIRFRLSGIKGEKEDEKILIKQLIKMVQDNQPATAQQGPAVSSRNAQAFMQRRNELRQEGDAYKREILYHQLLVDFPEPERTSNYEYDMIRSLLIIGFMEIGDTTRAVKYLQLMNNRFFRMSGAQIIAKSFIAKENYAAALQVMRRVMDTLTISAGEMNSAEKRITAFYADLLSDQKQQKEALLITESICKPGDEEVVCTVRFNILLANGKDSAALTILSELIKAGTATYSMKQKLPALYKAVYGNTIGYDTYVTPLLQAGQTAMQQQLKDLMCNDPAPSFAAPDRTGKLVSAASLKGKTVIVDVWSTYCSPCISSFPLMQELVNEYKADTTVAFVFLNQEMSVKPFDQRIKEIQQVLDMKKVDLDVLLDKRGSDGTPGTISVALGTRALPTKIIIDKNGIIRFRITGAKDDKEDERAFIKQLITMAKESS